jgi:hypothetical protein
MYNILSLDGGGSWSLLQFLTLRERYGNSKGHEILGKYDLVIATSGGSLVLAALCCNWDIDKCLSLFYEKQNRTLVFSKNSFWEKYFPADFVGLFGAGPKYSVKKKYAGLKSLFSEIEAIPMEDLPDFIGKPSLKLVVTTFDALHNKAKFFKSYGKEGKPFDSVNLIQAISGSTNAPIGYFDFPARIKAQRSERNFYLWDGALGGFNNPVAAGLTEAIKLGVSKEEINIISLGTSNKITSQRERKYFYLLYINVIKYRKTKPGLGLKFFGKTVINQAKTILYEPPDWANYMTYIWRFDNNLGQTSENKKRFIRLSPLLHRHSQDDNANEIDHLINRLYDLDMDLTNDDDIELLNQCFEKWKIGEIYNQPIRTNLDTKGDVLHNLGHKYFKEAMADWINMKI